MLVDSRVVRREEEDGSAFYELTHEYLIEQIAGWIGAEEYSWRRAQELVEQEHYNWTVDKQTAMSVERFALINRERSKLRLDPGHLDFLLMTAIEHSSSLEYWIAECRELSSQLHTALVPALDDVANGHRRRNAAVALAVIGEGEGVLTEAVIAVLAEVGNPTSLKLLETLGVSESYVEDVRRAISNRFAREMVAVAEGPFAMGSLPKEIQWVVDHFDIPRGWIEKEMPQHEVNVETFYMDACLVTNEQYAEFDSSHGYTSERSKHPAVNVDWTEAGRYAKWCGKRLPTEAEWEKAARGTDGRRFPWGDHFDQRRANSKESGIGTTTAVGSYPDGISPYGCLDMAGNVFEWTNSLVRPYPYVEDDREDTASSGVRIMRGGAFSYNYSLLRCALRYDYYDSTHSSSSLGFRCATDDNPASFRL